MEVEEEDAAEKSQYKLRERRAPPDKLLPNEDIGKKRKKWIEKLKANPEAYEQYRAKDRSRCKAYRASLSLEERKNYNEKTKLRMRKMREKKAKKPKGIKTRKTVEMEREYWRLKKQEQRSKMNSQAKRRVNENRRDKYHEKKSQKCKVKLDFGKEKVKKMSKSVQNPDVFAEGIQNIMENATPRKKAALKDKGIVFTPKSKERYRMSKTVAERMKSFLEKYKKSNKKEPRMLRRSVTKALIGKSYNDHIFRRSLSIKWDYWARMSAVGEEEVKRIDALSHEKISHIKQFYLDESQILPDKRHASLKTGLSKRLLGQTLRQAHNRYVKKYPNRKISLSTFQKLRPKEVISVDKQKFVGCLCEYCLNVQYKCQKLNSIASSKGREDLKLDTKYDVTNLTLCMSENQNLACVNRECKRCGVFSLETHFRPLAFEDKTLYEWNRWGSAEVNGNKRPMLLKHTGSIQDIINELCEEVDKLAKHLFVAQWQYNQFSNLTKKVPKNWLVMVADFAENYRCTQQDEIQSAYYHYQQVTIHPIVSYYMCNTCEEVICESAVFISDDLVHDAYAVEHFTRTYEEYLKKGGIQIEKEVLFSDGCASQYKSKLPFYFMSEHGLNFQRAYFGSRHGKGPCDGVGGVVKKSAETFVKGRQGNIRSPKEFYEYCQNNLQKGNGLSTEGCIHKKRVFFYVENIQRPKPKQLKTLVGTRNLHSARGSTEPGLVKVRELSCYCQACQNNQYEACVNKDVVGAWKDHCLLPGGKRGTKYGKDTSNKDKKPKHDKKGKYASKKVNKTKDKKKELKKAQKGDTDNIQGDINQTGKKKYIRRGRSTQNKSKISTEKNKNGGQNLKNIKIQLEGELLGSLPEIVDHSFVSTKKCIHKESVELVPIDLPIESRVQLYPAKIFGDGNCLSRCGSFLAYGHEGNHFEIRKRIALEMIINKHLYLDNEIMKKGRCPSGNSDVAKTFAMYSSQYTGGRLTHAEIESIYEKEIIEITQPSIWMGVWQIAALATVLSRPIVSVYPSYGLSHNVRSDLNRVFHPLNNSKANPVYIMWSHIDGATVPESNFTTNHFVVLLPMILDESTSDIEDSSVDFSEEENTNFDIGLDSLVDMLDSTSPASLATIDGLEEANLETVLSPVTGTVKSQYTEKCLSSSADTEKSCPVIHNPEKFPSRDTYKSQSPVQADTDKSQSRPADTESRSSPLMSKPDKFPSTATDKSPATVADAVKTPPPPVDTVMDPHPAADIDKSQSPAADTETRSSPLITKLDKFPSTATDKSPSPVADAVKTPPPPVDTVMDPPPAADTVMDPAADTVMDPAPGADTVMDPAPAADTVMDPPPAADTVIDPAPAADIDKSQSPAADTETRSSPLITKPDKFPSTATDKSPSPVADAVQTPSPPVDTLKITPPAEDTVMDPPPAADIDKSLSPAADTDKSKGIESQFGYNTGDYIMIHHGQTFIPAVVDNWPWIRFFTKTKKKDYWVLNEVGYTVLAGEVDRLIPPPDIKMCGTRILYCFTESRKQKK